jgi:hypothetical protein
VPWNVLNKRLRYSIKAVRIMTFSSFLSMMNKIIKNGYLLRLPFPEK